MTKLSKHYHIASNSKSAHKNHGEKMLSIHSYVMVRCKTVKITTFFGSLLREGPKLLGPKGDAEVAEEVKTALEEEAQEEKVEKAENRSQ